MSEQEHLAEKFEQNRPHLRAVAYRMLGSLSAADDAVQEAWLKLNRSGDDGVENLGGWLTTVVARVCLDMLRAQKSKREEPLDEHAPRLVADRKNKIDPEQETLLADSVGLALLVVLETLAPAERLAFVLHDMFDLSFDQIADIVGRTPVATRQLASRARRRVQGTDIVPDANLASQRKVVDAFLVAVRNGDFNAMLALLDPDAVLRTDGTAVLPGAVAEIRGATAIADRAVKGGARAARPVLIDGAAGVVIAPRGRLLMVLRFTIRQGKIVDIEAVADPERVRQLNLAVLDD